MTSRRSFSVRRLLARLALLGAAAGGALVAACGDPISPKQVAGAYALRDIDGRPLPYVTPDTAPTGLLADTMWYDADGVWREVAVYGPVRGTGPTRTTVYSGTWTLDARTRTIRGTQLSPSIKGDASIGPLRVEAGGAWLLFDTGRSPDRYWTYMRVP